MKIFTKYSVELMKDLEDKTSLKSRGGIKPINFISFSGVGEFIGVETGTQYSLTHGNFNFYVSKSDKYKAMCKDELLEYCIENFPKEEKKYYWKYNGEYLNLFTKAHVVMGSRMSSASYETKFTEKEFQKLVERFGLCPHKFEKEDSV